MGGLYYNVQQVGRQCSQRAREAFSFMFSGKREAEPARHFRNVPNSSSSSFNWSSKEAFMSIRVNSCQHVMIYRTLRITPMLLPKLSYTSVIVGLTFCLCTLLGIMANKKNPVQHSTIFEEFVPISLSQKNREVPAVPINCWKNGQKAVWCSERSRL